MKTCHLLRVLPAFVIATAVADTFELKDGTTLEGTILREEGADYVLSVQVTKSIRDERVVPKADVVKHTRERKDEAAYAELTGLVPTPDLKSEASYAKDIDKVEDFIKKYPDSMRKKDVAKIFDTLSEELAVIKEGGVKFQGKMITASERTPKAYGLDASMLAQEFSASAERGDYMNALRSWAKLEKEYPGSEAYREGIPTAVKVMKAYLMLVNTTLSGFDARTKDRANGLAGMDTGNRRRSEQAIKDEQNAYTARYERDKAEGHRWLPLDPYVKQPLEEAKRYLESEIRRLENLDLSYAPKTQEVYEQTYAEVTRAGATKPEIDAALSKARSASMPPQYMEMLEKAAPKLPAP